MGCGITKSQVQTTTMDNNYQSSDHDDEVLLTSISNVRQAEQLLTMNVMNDSISSVPEGDSHRQEAVFMYAQLLKEILLDMPSNDASKVEMVDFCRKQYLDNESELRNIQEFEEKYRPENAIRWYTNDTFLYRLLNKALRDQNTVILYKLRFFLKDLNDQIQISHRAQFLHKSTATLGRLTVYRGCGMSLDEFEKLKSNIGGGFMSISSFLSTSRKEEIALSYANQSLGNPKMATKTLAKKAIVLFEIEIDIEQCQTSFADVQFQSQFEHENEILFTMGSVFRIESITKSTNNLIWNVHLKLTGEEDEKLRNLTKYMKENIIWLHPLISLGDLMRIMAQYSKAEYFYLLALEQSLVTENLRTLASVYNDLGTVYNEMNQTDNALEYYEKSLNIKLKHFSSNDPTLAATYTNLGSMSYAVNEYDLALIYYEKALEIDQNAVNPNLSGLATDYNNIGLVYKKQRRYQEALEYYEKSLAIRLKILPANHSSLSVPYNNIAMVYSAQRNEKKSIEYLRKSLEIEFNSLPAQHPSIAITYQNLSMAYDRSHQTEKALEYMKKAYEIDLIHLSADDPQLVQNRERIIEVEQHLHALNS